MENYKIRIPLKMTQITYKDGNVLPLTFDWEENGETTTVTIDEVINIKPFSDIRSGTVGDRYKCKIDGKQEYLFYSKLAPRKWFIIKEVSEEEYTLYYKLPGET